MQPDLNLLVVFDAIAETGSVSRAAERLSLSQPAVSHALNRLRDLTGDPLFLRGHRKLVMTARAQALAARAKAVVAEAKSMLATPVFLPQTDRRQFVVGASDYAAMTAAPALVARCRQLAPQVTITFDAVGGQTMAELRDGSLDLSFWGASPPKRPWHWHKLWDETHVGVMCRHHPLAALARNGTISLADYTSFPHMSVSLHTPGVNRVDAALAEVGVSRQHVVFGHGFSGVLRAILGTDLVATLPATLMALLKSPDHALFSLPFHVPAYEYGFIWHERSHNDPGLSWLRSQLESSVPVP